MAESNVKPDMSAIPVLEEDKYPILKRVKFDEFIADIQPSTEMEIVSTEIKTESSAGTEGEEEKNLYAYLERDEFSSEHFKIQLKGLPRFFGFKVWVLKTMKHAESSGGPTFVLCYLCTVL